MPFVVNGIGTWYYGKRHIHTFRDNCQFCGNHADLSSFDTTLYFVVVFVPLIPLGQKRIINQCSYCEKHRVSSLSEWERAKQQDFADVQELLLRDPNNRDATLRTLSLRISYQDEPLFKDILESIGGKWKKDAVIQGLVGDGHAFFARWPEAEQAYRASLAVIDNEVIREQLGWALLKQDRPDEARPYLQHILDKGKRESAGSLYYLVAGYQAQGRTRGGP